ncbi:DUF5719 family protein [Demequina sp. TTPB684]|uniref:DUF5719 family protein n=1 Tax=unclassified Demequina TaxID=2620311 RepID=UPI001CF1D415|nr:MULTISPECIES: DUF5719 family protein [unclassified Demequina]MCB2413600.1 DUF5719 family protein [Demequina sp. TTPB684]UPU88547.1 DUF5719 family protein [Demequina sp. TMPB413]
MIRRITLTAGALGLVGVSAFLVTLAEPPVLETRAPQTFQIEAPAPVVACPGPQSVPVGDVGTGGDLASEPTVRTIEVAGTASTTAVGLGLGANDDIALQVERIGDGDIEGWAALTCAQPSYDQWIVGGATTLGASSRLVLSNPSTAPTEATVTVYGPLGALDDPLLVPVAAGDTVQRLIEGVAAELSAIVVRVEATGPGVVAALQDSRLEGFQPAGTAWVGTSGLAADLAIPLVNADAQPGQGGSAEGETGDVPDAVDLPEPTLTVRLMAPDGANVDLSLVSVEGGEEWSVGQPVALEAGVVTEVDVPTEALGAIEIRADAPIVAAARTSVARLPREGLADDVAYDHTWVPAMPVLTETTLTAVVPADDARLAVYAPFEGSVEVLDQSGAVVGAADMAEGSVQWVPITAPFGTRVSIEGRFAWSLVMTSPEGYIAAVAPVDLSSSSLTATVVPDTYPGATSP